MPIHKSYLIKTDHWNAVWLYASCGIPSKTSDDSIKTTSCSNEILSRFGFNKFLISIISKLVIYICLLVQMNFNQGQPSKDVGKKSALKFLESSEKNTFSKFAVLQRCRI